MDPKLTILFLLIGVVLVMFHLSEGTFARVRQRINPRSKRERALRQLYMNNR